MYTRYCYIDCVSQSIYEHILLVCEYCPMTNLWYVEVYIIQLSTVTLAVVAQTLWGHNKWKLAIF